MTTMAHDVCFVMEKRVELLLAGQGYMDYSDYGAYSLQFLSWGSSVKNYQAHLLINIC